MRTSLTLITSAVAALALAVPAAAAPKVDPLVGASQTAAATMGVGQTGYTGEGVGVAVLDTGISPQHATLGDQVAARIDVSGIGRNTDGLGHGTFLGGLIVGQEGPAGHRLGVAPDAHLVSVKVADAHGRTSLDRVLAGLAAVKAAPDELNIKVIVIAIGGPADDQRDPIEEALEQMWAEGYVVVVASGNDGELAEPGTSPYLLTVGAVDDAGTADAADDTVPAWSGRGVGRDGTAKPDVLAPGTSLVSTRVPGSIADRANEDSRIDGHWFRGSGTSQAAAVAAGAAAVLLQAHPTLSPDEVKGRLADSARPVSGSHAGVIDLPAALASETIGNADLPPIPLVAPEPPADTDADGQWDGDLWIGKSWNGESWNGKSWNGKSWNGYAWVTDVWVGKSWNGKSWNGKSWNGFAWADLSWDGKSWNGRLWTDQEWAEQSWASDAWDGKSWNGKSWNSNNWLGGAWFGKSWNNDSWNGGEWVSVNWFGRSWN